jgi:predicted N-acyltransferase
LTEKILGYNTAAFSSKEIVYTIQWQPNGKHRLMKGDVPIATFDTHALALEGLKRVVAPVISTFDKNGDPT